MSMRRDVRIVATGDLFSPKWINNFIIVVAYSAIMSQKVVTITGKNPIMVTKRILHREVARLWGVLVRFNGQEYRLSREDLIALIEQGKRPVMVDFPGADVAVALTVVKIGDSKFLRTAWDVNKKGEAELRNNFNRVKAVRLEKVESKKVLKA